MHGVADGLGEVIVVPASGYHELYNRTGLFHHRNASFVRLIGLGRILRHANAGKKIPPSRRSRLLVFANVGHRGFEDLLQEYSARSTSKRIDIGTREIEG